LDHAVLFVADRFPNCNEEYYSGFDTTEIAEFKSDTLRIEHLLHKQVIAMLVHLLDPRVPIADRVPLCRSAQVPDKPEVHFERQSLTVHLAALYGNCW
jgi:hypothetical protein